MNAVYRLEFAIPGVLFDATVVWKMPFASWADAMAFAKRAAQIKPRAPKSDVPWLRMGPSPFLATCDRCGTGQ